jgi:hypothetical protein
MVVMLCVVSCAGVRCHQQGQASKGGKETIIEYPENGLQLKVVYDEDGYNQVRVDFAPVGPALSACTLGSQHCQLASVAAVS